jgi:hypothetical protein
MNAAAPEGTPPRRIRSVNTNAGKLPAPPCLGEALNRGMLITENFIVYFRADLTGECLFQTVSGFFLINFQYPDVNLWFISFCRDKQ